MPATQDANFATAFHSSGSSRANTPADLSDNHNKNSISTNPFWSTTTSSSESTILHSAAADSPFDKVIFNAPNVTRAEVTSVSSKQSTPVHSAVLRSPSLSSSLIRLPPPPSRCSSRSKRSGLTANKVCHPVPTVVKKLDWDSASDASVKSLSSSRTGTPSANSVKNDFIIVSNAASTFTKTDHVLSFCEDEASSDPFVSTAQNENDLFQWAEPNENPGESIKSSAETPTFLESYDEKCVENIVNEQVENSEHEMQDITLIFEQVQTNDTIQCNTNTNAQVPATSSPVIDLVPPNEHCVEQLETNKVLPATPDDPLTALKKATSVESPNGIQEQRRLALPEVEIIETKTAWEVLMRFPREKRAMSNRKWVPIHIKLNCDQVCNIFRVFH